MPNKEKIPFGHDMAKPILVPLSKLDLDLNNARFRSDADGQEAAIALMLNSNGERCMELLSDICKRGNLNSSDIPIAVEEGNRYRVLEGNRRLTCLKLWKNPALLQKASPELADKYQKRIESLAERSQFAPPEKMHVVVAKSYDEADVWIDKKHGLGKDGSATVEWAAFEKDRRASRRTGKTGRALSFVRYLTFEFADDAVLIETLDKLLSRQYSILDRVLSNAVLREEIGIDFESSGVTTSKYPRHQIRPLLLAMLSDFAEKRQTAKTLHTAEQISAYFTGLHNKYLAGITPGDSGGVTHDPVSLESESTTSTRIREGVSGGRASDTANDNSSDSPIDLEDSKDKNVNLPAKREQRNVQNRIFTGLDMRGFSSKIQRLVSETSALSVSRQPELIAVSLRVILDLACTEFLVAFHDDYRNVKRDLDQRIMAVLKLLDPNCTQGVRSAETTAEFNKVFAWTKNNKESLRLAHYALHDVKHVNTPNETKILAERYEEMLVAMSDEMEQHGSS